MKFLIFATDLLPMDGLPTSGTALRTWGLAQGLRSLGHTVMVSTPSSAIEGYDRRKKGESEKLEIPLEVRALAFNAENQQSLICELNPDIIICGHWPALQLRVKPEQILIIDLAGPHILERHYQSSPGQKAAIVGKAAALASADGFIVSGPRQAEYFKSFLARAGEVQKSANMVQIVMPLSPEQPAASKESDNEYPQFFFGGVFLPWQDPSWSLGEVSAKLTQFQAGKLTLVGGKHPHYEINSGVYQKLFDDLALNPRVDCRAMLPLKEFREQLAAADVAVDLMDWNLERELAVTIRSTTYLWSGVPVIYNNFSDLADLIQKYDAGWCLKPGDSASLEAVLQEVYRSPKIVKNKSANASKLAKDIFSWDTALQPLVALIENILQAPGAKNFQKREFEDISIVSPDSANLKLRISNPISQRFICRQAGLKKIAVLLTSQKKAISAPVRIELRMLSASGFDFTEPDSNSDYQLVAKTELLAGESFDDNWTVIELCKPEPNSAGVWYELAIIAESDVEDLSPWIMHSKPYPMSDLFYGQEIVRDSALCLKTTFEACFR